MNARVDGRETVKPTLCPVDRGRGKRECEVVDDKTLRDLGVALERRAGGHIEKHQLGEAMQRLIEVETGKARRELDIETGEMFRVVRVGSDEEDDVGFIVVTVSHIIADGMGGLGFISEIIKRAVESVGETDVMVNKASTTGLTLPPTLESTIQLKPALMTIVAAVWSQLIVPKLPAFLGSRFVDEKAAWVWPEWPRCPDAKGDDRVDMATLQTDQKAVLIPVEMVDKLAAIAKARTKSPGTPRVKLTSILVAALLLAIHSTIDPSVEVYLAGNVPLSEREADLGHPAYLGNYMVPGSYRRHFPANDSRSEELRFWEIAEDSARRLEGDLRRTGRESWGLTEHIPDGQRDVEPVMDCKRSRGSFTGWEEYFGAMHKRTKCSSSFQFSNLGRVPTTFPKVDAIVWSQPAGAFGAGAIEVDCIGSTGGDIWTCFNWREGEVVGRVKVEAIVREFQAVLHRLATSIQ